MVSIIHYLKKNKKTHPLKIYRLYLAHKPLEIKLGLIWSVGCSLLTPGISSAVTQVLDSSTRMPAAAAFG